tara:strand:+ start:108 stop:383 length:276 start_codon:yes stop_codon:yes gene_type:complete
MRKINKQKVSDYIKSRTDEEIKHCPDCLACACNDAVRRFGHKNALDFLKLICFNDPIPVLHTHNYGFHTATGRNIIDTTIGYYNKYYNLEL